MKNNRLKILLFLTLGCLSQSVYTMNYEKYNEALSLQESNLKRIKHLCCKLYEAVSIDDLESAKFYLTAMQALQLAYIFDNEMQNLFGHAVKMGAVKVARYLLATYPNYYDVSGIADEKSGDTYLHLASTGGMVKLLLAYGALINARNNIQTLTPLEYALEYGNYAVAHTLIMHNAYTFSDKKALTPNAENSIRILYGSSPILVAILLDNVMVLKKHIQSIKKESGEEVLIDQINQDVRGLKPITSAISRGSFPSVFYLVIYGADLTAQDHYGRSLIELAELLNKKDIVLFLKQAAAASSFEERREIANLALQRYSIQQIRSYKYKPDYKSVQENRKFLNPPSIPGLMGFLGEC